MNRERPICRSLMSTSGSSSVLRHGVLLTASSALATRLKASRTDPRVTKVTGFSVGLLKSGGERPRRGVALAELATSMLAPLAAD